MPRILKILLIAGLLSAACSSNKTTSSYPAAVPIRRDPQISEDARRNLDARGLTNVQVQTENGEITLNGKVNDPEQKLLAEESVRTMPGVVGVKNNVSVVEENRVNKTNINANKPGGPRKE